MLYTLFLGDIRCTQTSPAVQISCACRSLDGKAVNLESTVGFEIDIRMFITAKDG